ncbi:MAG: transketolase [Candidatus Margulisbacteria bacterium]|nr:transketolase [Candidatus Margulisiibacteriota bacterium]
MKLNKEIRKDIVRMTYLSNSSHVGSCLSIVEILSVLFFQILNIDPKNPNKKNRDKFILSKAHGSAALYAVMARKGYFSRKWLDKFYIDNGKLPGHLDKEIVPGLETSGGSLGHGLSLGVGMALANKLDKNPGKIYVLLGCGECNEGSVWEAIMLAATKKLENLTAIVDFNELQSFGRTNEVIDQRNIKERWEAFGWSALEIDGHDQDAIVKAIKKTQQRPKVIIAHTIKGKGVSFMEDRLEWHYKSPTQEQYLQAIKELGGE